MASSKILVVLAALAVLVPSILATDYTVGDADGWNLGHNYTQWAAKYQFYVGDRLIFTYNKDSHNVLKVDGAAFKNCSTPNDAQTWNSGSDQIKINEPGKHWYICGFPNHCSKGMKFAIDVHASLGSPAPVPASAATAVASPMFFGSMVAAMVALRGMVLF